ncbi:MAG: CotH kinase family protein, partial [Candidatus Marinimicrobia bacterium]|nr:CotH kinase family protein [Candidatus Neomarinimicrobiota bacterium]
MIVHINKIFKSLTVLLVVCCCISAQNIYINELMSSNNSTLYDESGNSSDWIELYNAGDIEIDLTGFGLSDDINDPFKWVFPEVIVNPQSFLIVFASGEDVGSNVQHWETVINWGDNWSYFIGYSNPLSDWREPEFDDSDWSIGASGFGYGDGDDATEVPQVMSVFVRNSFQVGSVDDIAALVLHIDYDDAFVAYLNGSEIARANIGTPGVVPNYDEGAYVWREAEMYNGGSPERYDIDQESDLLTYGENVLAIQVHNYNITSSDMSLIPFFTLGMFQSPDNPSGTPDILNFPLTNLHTNFKIASEGEAILLTNSSGAMEDMVDSTAIPTDISYGRQPDGSDTWSFFPEPTPQGPNNTEGFGDYCETPEISQQGGFYLGPVIVTLSIESDNYQIYYTLDGSIPTEASSLYSQPISIQSTKVIRAAVIDNECFPGEVITHSYFINEESNLPVVSLTTDPYNLWDDEYGIYVLGNDAEWNFPYFGANFWEDWERPIHIELYEPNGELAFNLDAGVKIFGGWSRGWPQKSLAIYARPTYGTSEINYQIFPDKEIDSFSAIVLRNSGNDWFGSGESSATMFRDGVHTGFMDNTDIDHQAYRPSAVYINGEYWGIHNIREKVNEEFLASNNPGVDPDELDELEANAVIIEGDNQDYLNMIDFVENNDLSYSNNYALVVEQMDINNFIDYNIIQIYVGNTDWPGNNIKYWRPHIEGAKWKWILYDTDFGFGLFSSWAANVYHNTLLFALDDNGPGWPNPPWSTLLFRSLIENEEFQNKFINHFCYYLSTRF